MATSSSYSLLELNQYIRRVISLNFDEPIWIECEIGQVSSSRGHWYLDLIQKNDQEIVAQCQAAMWANVHFFLKRKYPLPPEEILKQGMSVKLKVNVDFHERYGLKLIIEDLDSSYTIGQLEMQRQAILNEIRNRGLVRKNAEVPLPPVVQRLAVISSSRAAGYQDFIKHLEENPYGYDMRLDLYESAMQGQQVEADIMRSLDEIEKAPDRYDAVAIIRGGGGRTDLAAFDNLNLSLRVAGYTLPVLIGIGHEIDQSVLDIVAHRSLKTPTAVADFLVEHNAIFEGALDAMTVQLQDKIYSRLRQEEKSIVTLTYALHRGVRSRIQREGHALDHAQNMLRHGIHHVIRRQQHRIDHMETLLTAVNPDRVLARGYTITSHQGRTLTKAEQARPGMTIQTTFINGLIKSKVE